MARSTLVLGEDEVVIYNDNLKVWQGIMPSFGDILEICRIPSDIATADLDWASRMKEAGKPYPDLLSEVPLESREHLTSHEERN